MGMRSREIFDVQMFRSRIGTALGAVSLVMACAVSALAADPPVATAPSAAESGPVARSTVDWRQIESPSYADYLDRLRAAGCPEDKIRLIVRADADEWLLQQRIAHAIAHDFDWWKAEPPRTIVEPFRDTYEQMRTRRTELVQKYLGPDAVEKDDKDTETPIVVSLSGPVLGALPREKYNAVQEICSHSLDRQQGYFTARQTEGVFLNQGDLAQMREKTRADLAQILSPEELEEFLLRYSHNANRLRIELAGMEPSPDEFREIFRAVDSLEHRVQLEYGAVDSLSARQRAEFESQREAAIKAVLPPDRYQRYLLGKYPLFRQAQLAIRRAGLPEKDLLPFYEVLNRHENKRTELLNNTALNATQRQAGLQDLERDKEAGLQEALGADGYRQYRDSLVN